jgi:hypothetical protein
MPVLHEFIGAGVADAEVDGIRCPTKTKVFRAGLSDIRIIVAPVPVHGLLPRVQFDESSFLVALGLVSLVGAVFIVVPGVIVLVVLVVVALVVVLAFFMVLVVLRAGGGHHRDRRGKGSGEKK